MATVTVKWSGNPPCGKGSVPYVGELYSLYLNQTFFSTDVSSAISATFVSEGAGGPGYDRTYTFTIPDTSLPEGFSEIDSCHVKSIACIDSCCVELQRQINEIEVGGNTFLVSAAYDPDSGDVTYTLSDGSTVVGSLPAITVEGSNNATTGTSTSSVNLGQTLRLWSAGGLTITASGNSVVRIEPNNISVNVAVAGAPTAPPLDTSRTAIHFASDGQYFWDPVGMTWITSTTVNTFGTVAGDGNAAPYVFTFPDATTASIQLSNPAADGSRTLTVGTEVMRVCPCPEPPIVVLPAAFANPEAPTAAEAEIWITANGNNRPGQVYTYNTPAGGNASAEEPDYIWEDVDGTGGSVVELEEVGVAATPPSVVAGVPLAQATNPLVGEFINHDDGQGTEAQFRQGLNTVTNNNTPFLFDSANRTLNIPVSDDPVNFGPVVIGDPTDIEALNASAGTNPGTIIWTGGTQDNPDFAWIVNPDGSVTRIEDPDIDEGGIALIDNAVDNCVIDIVHTGSDGVADITDATGLTGAGLGRVNSYAQQSVPANVVGTYTVHELRGENDGTAIDTETVGIAQKVLIEETNADCERESIFRVENYEGATVFVDLKYGNNATALRERSDRPFLTYQAAHLAAVDGDTIKIATIDGTVPISTGNTAVFAIGKRINVDLSNVSEVQGTLRASAGGELNITAGNPDVYSLFVDSGTLKGSIGDILHPVDFTSVIQGAGSSVVLSAQNISDAGGSAINNQLIRVAGTSTLNLHVRGDVDSNRGFIDFASTAGGKIGDITVDGDIRVGGPVPTIVQDTAFLTANTSVGDTSIEVKGNVTSNGGRVAWMTGQQANPTNRHTIKIGGTVTSHPLDNVNGAGGVIVADATIVEVSAKRAIALEGGIGANGAVLSSGNNGQLIADIPYLEAQPLGTFLATAGGTGTTLLKLNGFVDAFHPDIAGDFHDNTVSAGSSIRFSAVVSTNLTGAPTAPMPYPTRGGTAGLTFDQGTYLGSQNTVQQ